MNKLPKDVIYHILSFNDQFKVRKGKLVQIIPSNDPRRAVLERIPLITPFGHIQLSNTRTYVMYIMVSVSSTDVRWTLYKYFKNTEEDDVMEGVVFSMDRHTKQSVRSLVLPDPEAT
jgi:hypothetical protein